MLFGPGAATLLAAAPLLGADTAAVLAVGGAIAASFALAIPFRHLDLAALTLGRQIRDRQSRSRQLRNRARPAEFAVP